jgi:hypothetical protein
VIMALVSTARVESKQMGVEAKALELAARLDTEQLGARFRDACAEFLHLFSAAAEECSAAVVHPLGFAVFRWDFSPMAALRVHVWSDLTKQTDPTVDARHDHLWRLRSYVLVGELRDHILQVDPIADRDADTILRDSELWEVARVIQKDETDVVSPKGELVRVWSRDSLRVAAGEFYTVPAGAMHWTEAGVGRPIATVVSATVEEDLVPRTLIAPGSGGRPLTPRRKIDLELRSRIVEAVLKALDR